MLNLEDFMNMRDLKQQGWSVSAIAGELHLDRKTVRKHLQDAPQPYKRENPAPCKIDPYRPFLRERWEKGVHNARKLLDEIRLHGYGGRKGASAPSCASRPVLVSKFKWTGVTSATGADAGFTASP
jgi:transposase